jgi:predicted alpha/beta superfamily hydrolase
MQEIILVAVDNSRARYTEYRGPIYAEGKPAKLEAPSRFDSYADFLARELKPKIDREYRTRPAAANTAVMGSSLGGICSLALAWDRPKVFGAAASLSGSYQIEKRNFLEQALRPYQGKRKPIRIYLDSGTIDFTGDDDGRKHTQAVAGELRRIGWKDGSTLRHFVDARPMTDAELERAGLRRDKWHEARTSQHNEFYWRQRAWRALEFLFPPK